MENKMHNLEKDTKQIRAIITLVIASALLC